MDDLDRSLLALLTRDARQPAAALAAALQVSRATVQARIARLIASGAIRRFTIDAGPDATPGEVSAFSLLKLASGDPRPSLTALGRLAWVTSAHTINGAFDLVVEVRCPSLPVLDQALDAIRALPAVLETQTHIRLAEVRTAGGSRRVPSG
ncbi:MAG: Lrp/AsnC family transcriptional regulator [Alphaproteobacteria bacterium]|nr:Lrp/AsnC family transcriptional regulator [Alphaproteobacteria bacterium]TAD88767.1 MAG: Lrp/AsnC family transcriptional regulator [Alphaproteobacteria bacterium]